MTMWKLISAYNCGHNDDNVGRILTEQNMQHVLSHWRDDEVDQTEDYINFFARPNLDGFVDRSEYWVRVGSLHDPEVSRK